MSEPERNTRTARRKANIDNAWVVAIGRTRSGTVLKRTGGRRDVTFEIRAGAANRGGIEGWN